MKEANRGGWKTCSRGHKYRGDHCPICWKQRGSTGGMKRTKTPGGGRRSR